MTYLQEKTCSGNHKQFSAQLSFWVPSVKRLNWFRIFPNKSLNNYRITLTENKIEIDLVHQKKQNKNKNKKTFKPAGHLLLLLVFLFFHNFLKSF